MRNISKKFSHLYLPAEILLGCSEDFSSGKTTDSSIIKIPMVNGDRLYSSLDRDSCPLPVTFFHHLHDCVPIFKVRRAIYIDYRNTLLMTSLAFWGSFQRKTFVFFYYTEVGGWWGKSTIIVHYN